MMHRTKKRSKKNNSENHLHQHLIAYKKLINKIYICYLDQSSILSIPSDTDIYLVAH